jgi:hypothetical protein
MSGDCGNIDINETFQSTSKWLLMMNFVVTESERWTEANKLLLLLPTLIVTARVDVEP